jgi:hypothetical protein
LLTLSTIASCWQYAHLLFVMSYIPSAAALSRLVLAHDCANADPHDLAHVFEERSHEELYLGLRLFYSTGLGIALFSTFLIALCHQHKLPVDCRVPKYGRLGNRLAVAVILCALPAAQSLTSLSFVAITTCLMFEVLLVELWGKSCRRDTFFGAGVQGDCKYTARCNKRTLDAAMQSDGEVDVNILSKREKRGADVIDVS